METNEEFHMAYDELEGARQMERKRVEELKKLVRHTAPLRIHDLNTGLEVAEQRDKEKERADKFEGMWDKLKMHVYEDKHIAKSKARYEKAAAYRRVSYRMKELETESDLLITRKLRR